MTIKPEEHINGNAKKINQKPPSTISSSSQKGASVACPFIGLEDDPGTRLLFASPVACCHRADPIHAVELVHQQAYCLNTAHSSCPVFMRPEWGALPEDLQYHLPQRSGVKMGWLALVVLLLLLGLLAGYFYFGGNGNFALTTEPNSNDDPAAAVVIITRTATPTATKVATAIPTPTATLVPTETAVPTQPATATTQPTATLVPTYTPVTPDIPTVTAVSPLVALVNVPRLNVRIGPGTDYDSSGLVDEGEEFELTGRLADGSWLQICCVNGESGWVISEAIDIPVGAVSRVPIIQDLPPVPTVQP